MLKVEVLNIKYSSFYFCIQYNSENYWICRTISDLLEIPLKNYIDKLIKEVIIHSNYKIQTYVFCGKTLFDVVFDLNDVPRETYVNRFKEVFAPQLTLLTLKED